MEALEEKKDTRRWSRGINFGYAGTLKICLESKDMGFGEYGSCWVGISVELLEWKSLVKDNL